MARIRSLKPEFCTSLDIAQLSIPCRLHFAMLWTYSDDAGRGIDDPRLIKAALWPLDDDVTAVQVEAWQVELEDKGRIVRYEAEGKALFEIIKFADHQKPNRVVPSKLPSSAQGTARAVHEQCMSSADAEKSTAVVEGSCSGEVEESSSSPLYTDREPFPVDNSTEDERIAAALDIVAEQRTQSANPNTYGRYKRSVLTNLRAEENLDVEAARLLHDHPNLTAAQLASCLNGDTTLLRHMPRKAAND